jgi:hypothetical protein
LSLKRFMRKYFIFMYLFYPPSIKIVFPENTNPSWLIPKTGQLGFFPTVSFMTDAEFVFPQRSHTRTLSFSVSLIVCLFPLLSVLV